MVEGQGALVAGLDRLGDEIPELRLRLLENCGAAPPLIERRNMVHPRFGGARAG